MSISAPTDISNCELYLDAHDAAYSDAGSTHCTFGDTIQQLSDLSGNGRHATQATSGSRPTYMTLQGVGAARFLASHFLDTGSFLGSGHNTAFTCWAVCEPQDAAFRVLCGDVSGAGYRQDMNADGANNEQANYYTPNLSDTLITPTVARQSLRIEVFRYDGATKRVRIAGPDADTAFSEAATGNLGLSGAFRLGQYSGGGFGYSGFVRACGVYNRKITDGETDDLAAWALAKFMAHSAGSRSSGTGTGVLVCDGNSITLGSGTTPYPTQLASLLTGSWSVSNQGIGGMTIGQMNTDLFRTLNTIDALFDATARKNICVYFEGINDVQNGASGAQSFQRHKDYGLRRRYKGYQTIVCTCPAAGTATANQETARQDLNTLLRANWTTFADGFADIASDPAFDTQADTSNTTYYNADTIHLTTAGNAIIASYVAAAVNSVAAGGPWPFFMDNDIAGGLLTLGT